MHLGPSLHSRTCSGSAIFARSTACATSCATSCATPSPGQARADVFDYIENVFNRQHSHNRPPSRPSNPSSTMPSIADGLSVCWPITTPCC